MAKRGLKRGSKCVRRYSNGRCKKFSVPGRKGRKGRKGKRR